MNDKQPPHEQILPADMPDADRTWQGDHDPYLGRLAHEQRKQRAPAPGPGQRVKGPADDGDPYLAQLMRANLRDRDRR